MYTHKELINIGKKWLSKIENCYVIIAEKQSDGSGEIPDILAYKSSRHSILIECKVSRSDFRKDKDKWFRQDGYGMGQQRYFLAPAGIIPPHEVPDGWGLLEIEDKTLKKIINSDLKFFDENRVWAEIPLLIATIKKLQRQNSSLRKKSNT